MLAEIPQTMIQNMGLENIFIQRACTDNRERQETPEAELVHKTESTSLTID